MLIMQVQLLLKNISTVSRGYKVTYVFIAILMIALAQELLFGSGGIIEYVTLNKEIKVQQTDVDRIAEINNHLAKRIKVLKSHYASVEGQARYELGLVKQNETFYQVVLAVYDE